MCNIDKEPNWELKDDVALSICELLGENTLQIFKIKNNKIKLQNKFILKIKKIFYIILTLSLYNRFSEEKGSVE